MCNALFPGYDDLILAKIFQPDQNPFRIITLDNTFYLKDEFKEFLINPYPSPLQLSKLPIISNLISDELEKWVKEDYACAITLDYSPKLLSTIRRIQTNRRIMKRIKQLNVPVLPVRLFSTSTEPDGAEIKLRIGRPISVKDQQAFKNYHQFGKFVQAKINALGSPLEVRKFYLQNEATEPNQFNIIPPTPKELILEDIKNLTYENLIFSQSHFDVFIAKAIQLPNTLFEIGRLRELTFRDVGEGTGMSLDLDEFDLYYRQLIIWDRENQQIAGGYRLGLGDEIFMRYGKEGFYINTLFKIKKGFYPIMKSSVELGRSYVTKEYQKQRLPLFLLWKGIMHFLLQNPRYRYLYGPLSISKYYSEVTKGVIVAFVKKFYFDHKLAEYLEPRKPFKPSFKHIDVDVLVDNFQGELRNLDNFIEDIEPDHFKLPVLLKQYVKQNAKFISFNVDPNFSDVLDGFMLLDLKELPYTTIESLKGER